MYSTGVEFGLLLGLVAPMVLSARSYAAVPLIWYRVSSIHQWVPVAIMI
jgi:Flp pilus assembly pilin Flp